MTSHVKSAVAMNRPAKAHLAGGEWSKLGLSTALVSIAAVWAVQALAIAWWPEIALFAPLASYARVALFTLIPVLIATVLLARLVRRQTGGVQRFITISVIVLLLSIIPDYILPVPDRTLLASTVTAFLHVVVALITVVMLVRGYQRRMR